MIDQVGLDSSNGCVLANLDVNELIWDDSHGLQRQSLYLGPGESLDDPTLTLLLKRVNLLLDQFNHNLIINYKKGTKVRRIHVTPLDISAPKFASTYQTGSC